MATSDDTTPEPTAAETAIIAVREANPLHKADGHLQAPEQVVLLEAGASLVQCSCGVTLVTRPAVPGGA